MKRPKVQVPAANGAGTGSDMRRLRATKSLAETKVMAYVVMSIPALFCVQVSQEGQLARHYSYGEIGMVVLLLYLAIRVLLRKEQPYLPTMCCLAVSAAYLLSGLVNQTASSGTILTFARNWLLCGVLYQVVFRLACDGRFRTLIQRLCVVMSLILGGLWANAAGQRWWSVLPGQRIALLSGADSVLSVTNNNGLGMCFVFLSVPCFIAVIEHRQSALYAVGVVTGILGVVASFSRTAYICIAVVAICASIDGFSRRRRSSLALIIFAAGISIAAYFWALQTVPGAEAYWSQKVNRSGEELRDLRFGQLILEPIVNWSGSSLVGILFGDGKSFQHSVISNAIVMTGMLGFVCVMTAYAQMFLGAVRRGTTGYRPRASVNVRWLLGGTVCAMFAGDCVTNLIDHLPTLASLFVIVVASFSPQRVGADPRDARGRVPEYGNIDRKSVV